MHPPRQTPIRKFFADRGTHLAAMIAYFALLSLVPLVFLALALLGLAGRAETSSFFVAELRRAFPGSSVSGIVHAVRTVQSNAAALGILGGSILLWSALSLFSALESALNIVYGRPNRTFFHGKGVAAAITAGSLLTLFASLVAGGLGVEALRRYAPSLVGSYALAYVTSVIVSFAGIFFFLLTVYRVLTNAPVTVRSVLPGALTAAVILEASFQALPLFVRYADISVTLRAFGGPAILLIWLYVMANIIVLGAEVNWWLAYERPQSSDAASAPGPSPRGSSATARRRG